MSTVRALVTGIRHERRTDFPKPHMDYIEHTIAYQVDGKTDPGAARKSFSDIVDDIAE